MKQRLSVLIAVLITLSLSTTGCTNPVAPLAPAEEESINKGSIQKEDLRSWAGAYGFYEFYPPNQNMTYTVTIYDRYGEYYADICIDGFQTIRRMKANVTGDSESIDLVLETYLPDNDFESIDLGEVVLSFKR